MPTRAEHRTAMVDLFKHLDKRIETVLSDYMDRCAEYGLSYEHATTGAITILGHYFVCASLGIDATAEEIKATCQWHYNDIKKKLG